MTTVDAIYKDGVFQPTERIALPDDSRVRLSIEPVPPSDQARAIDEIYRIMGQRFQSGEHDVAERHNEHQP